MALTQTQVSQLYVTLFGRVSEGAGNKYWQNAVSDVAAGADAMLATTAAQEYFGSALTSDEAFIKHIYKNTLNKSEVEDPAGIKFWVDALKAGNSRGLVVSELIKAAIAEANKGTAQDLFNNKVALSDYTAEKVEGKGLGVKDLAPFKEALTKVTSNVNSLTDAKTFVDSLTNIAPDNTADWSSTPANPGTTATLTYATDELTANVFNAPMDYNKAGTDRVLTLNSEDVLTGDASRSDNTLNATFGQKNADEGDAVSRTPVLKNIQNINIQATGDVNTLDLRNADDVEKINIYRITKETVTDSFNVESIGQKLDGMRLADVAKKEINVKFEHKKGVLSGFEDKSNVYLEKVDAKSLSITSDANTEGYEQLNLVSKQDVSLDKFEANQLRELTIKGSGSLEIADVDLNAGENPQFYEVKDGGIKANGTRGFTKLDASNYNGKLTLDISDIVKNAFDPFDSGKKQYTDIAGSKQGDTFYLRNGVENRISINGGEGQDKLVMVGGSIGEYETEGKATITNIETLEMRAQTGNIDVDFDRFDENLKNVVVRNESLANVGAAEIIRTFTLNDISEKFAKEGEIVVEHGVGHKDSDDNYNTKIVANLKDAKGKDDTLNFKVVDANNKDNTFEYEIGAKDVENLKINDSDSESNSVKFTNADHHTGTITLTGGTKDLYYAVEGEVVAKTVDASAQKSDLRLAVKDQGKNPGQDIKLGAGNDVLTFAELDGLDGKDKITDAGGDNDTVRAIFSKDGVLNLAGIEGIHIAASKNVTLDIVSSDVSKLVVMSQQAVAQTDKVSSLGYGVKGMGKTVDATKIITVKSATNITELNFKGDLDNSDQKGTKDDPFVDDQTDQSFNGVKLLNNKAESVNVNIDSKLDDIEKGAKSYTVEQITVDGTKNITVNVNDERIKKDAATVTTEIKNIAGKNLETLTLNAKRDLNLNTVTANDLNNSISLVDASNVVGKFTAQVVGLGDGATVKISDGGSKFNALGSAGKGIKITAGDGKNEITGSAQSDFITTGSANDKVYAHRGDNVIDVGDGDDIVTARDGNDTVAFGRGYDSYKDNFGTSINAVNAATTVTKLAGVANVQIAVNGNKAEAEDITLAEATAAGTKDTHINQVIASAEGSTLKVQWQGGQIQGSATTLNGRFAENYKAGDDTWHGFAMTGADLKTGKGDDKDNFWIAKGAQNAVVNGGDGNDVVITAPDVDKLTFNGGNGNDAAVGTKGEDVFEGGKGADVFATNNIYKGGKVADDEKTDTIKIADGESVKGSHDVIYGFSTAAADSDKLNLSSTLVADDKAAGAQDIASGQGKAIQAYGITNGVATFYSDADHAQTTVVNSKNLNDVLDYFAKELNGTTKTVAFAYDQDGDGNADSTFLFQDGAEDTVVQLAGTTGVQALGGAAGADTIVLA